MKKLLYKVFFISIFINLLVSCSVVPNKSIFTPLTNLELQRIKANEGKEVALFLKNHSDFFKINFTTGKDTTVIFWYCEETETPLRTFGDFKFYYDQVTYRNLYSFYRYTHDSVYWESFYRNCEKEYKEKYFEIDNKLDSLINSHLDNFRSPHYDPFSDPYSYLYDYVNGIKPCGVNLKETVIRFYIDPSYCTESEYIRRRREEELSKSFKDIISIEHFMSLYHK